MTTDGKMKIPNICFSFPVTLNSLLTTIFIDTYVYISIYTNESDFVFIPPISPAIVSLKSRENDREPRLLRSGTESEELRFVPARVFGGDYSLNCAFG